MSYIKSYVYIILSGHPSTMSDWAIDVPNEALHVVRWGLRHYDRLSESRREAHIIGRMGVRWYPPAFYCDRP